MTVESLGALPSSRHCSSALSLLSVCGLEPGLQNAFSFLLEAIPVEQEGRLPSCSACPF